MKKTPRHSVDGFIPRRQTNLKLDATRSSRGEMRRATFEAPKQEKNLPRPTGLTRADISNSLRAIDDEPEEKAPKKRWFLRNRRVKKPQSRRRKITKRIGIIIAIILAIVAGYFVWKFIITGNKIFIGNPFDLLQKQRLKEDSNGRTNVLIFGTSGYKMDDNSAWDGALLTDSIMVVSINQDDYSAYTISLPRDLYVGTCTATGKLNEIYYCAHDVDGKDGKAAADAFRAKVGEVTGLDVQYYAHANWSALQQGVNAVGGVKVKIESDDPRGIYDVATGINYKNGEVVKLNGERALAFARARNSSGGYGLANSNFDREKNQQKLIAALQKKATSATTLANPAAVSKLMDALGDNLRTNFQKSEIRTLIDIAQNTDKMTSLPLVDRGDDLPDLVTNGSVGGISIVQPVAGLGIYTEIQEYILKSILGDKMITVDVLNGSAKDGLAATKADELKGAGYLIGAVDNAPENITVKVKIYQINETKMEAAEKLARKYSVKVEPGAPIGYTPNVDSDFVIIFGD